MTNRILIFFPLLFFMTSCSDSSTSNEEPAQTETNELKQETETITKKNIIFFGNSLTAAYGLDIKDGYVSLIQQRLDSLGLNYKTINAGLSGETTAGGKERINWVLRQPVDIFILELGGNDALRGLPTEASQANLEAIIVAVKEKNPDAKIILAGMEAPPNMGDDYTASFRKMYPAISEKHGTALIPFFLENVAGIPELNQDDRVHPNKEAQQILVENVWKVLKEVL